METIESLVKSADKARNTVIELSYSAKSAHLGSSLSCVELTTYFLSKKQSGELNKFILSKGHAAMALYSCANVLGLIDDSHLKAYLKNDTELWGHPSYNPKFKNFIDWSTGSLGHGLPVTVGFGLANRMKNNSARVACVLSDGELNEGTNWEAFMFAGHHKLNNVVAAIDFNKIQSYGIIKDVMDLHPLVDKFKSFNWEVIEVDGHSITEIDRAFNTKTDKPLMIIAHTIKGKGIAELENTLASHYKPATEAHLKEKRFI